MKDYNIRLYNSSFAQIGLSQLTGAANDTIKKNLTTAGTYYLKVYGVNATAFSVSQCYNLRINVSNINFRMADEFFDKEISTLIKTDLKVFPNPVHDNLNVVYTTSNAQSILRIYDMVGNTVKTIPLETTEGENKFNIDFAEIHKGIYFVEVIEEGNKITKKILVE